MVLILDQGFVNENSWKEAVSAKTKWIQQQWCVEWRLEHCRSRGYLEFTFAALVEPIRNQMAVSHKIIFYATIAQLAYLVSDIDNITCNIQNLNPLGQLLIFFLPQLPTQKLPALWKLASWKKTGTSVLSWLLCVYNQSVCCLHQQSLVIWFWKTRKGNGNNLCSFEDRWRLPG